MAHLWEDLRHSIRMMRNNPGFTVVAVLTLALGMGATTAVFSVVEDVLLRPLPYENPESLAEIWNTYFPTFPQIGLSGADFENWRQQTRDLSEMAAYRFIGQGFNVTGESGPQRLEATYATSNLFPLLGVRLVAGHAFDPKEDEPGSAPVVMISHRVWQDRFGSSPSVIGRLLNLDGIDYTLIGVLPSDFDLASWADLWVPIGQMDPNELSGRVFHPFGVIARLKTGVSVLQAQARTELRWPIKLRLRFLLQTANSGSSCTDWKIRLPPRYAGSSSSFLRRSVWFFWLRAPIS